MPARPFSFLLGPANSAALHRVGSTRVMRFFCLRLAYTQFQANHLLICPHQSTASEFRIPMGIPRILFVLPLLHRLAVEIHLLGRVLSHCRQQRDKACPSRSAHFPLDDASSSSSPLLKLIPLVHNVIEVFKYNFTDLFPVSGRHAIGIGFLYVEISLINPILALRVALSAMYVDWLASFVRIEEKPPAQ